MRHAIFDDIQLISGSLAAQTPKNIRSIFFAYHP